MKARRFTEEQINFALKQAELPRDCRRLHFLRGWGHDTIQTILPRDPGAAVRLVLEHQSRARFPMGAIRSIASKIGCSPETLRSWVRRAERDQGHRPGLTTEERQQIKDLEREVRELRRTNEILRKASAFSTQAELDCKPK